MYLSLEQECCSLCLAEIVVLLGSFASFLFSLFQWSAEELRQYISWVRAEFRPQLSSCAALVLQRYYELRRRILQSAYGFEKDTAIAGRTTLRLLESLVRLTQAHARLMSRDATCVEVSFAYAFVENLSRFIYRISVLYYVPQIKWLYIPLKGRHCFQIDFVIITQFITTYIHIVDDRLFYSLEYIMTPVCLNNRTFSKICYFSSEMQDYVFLNCIGF